MSIKIIKSLRMVYIIIGLVVVSACSDEEILSFAHHPWPGYELIELHQVLLPETASQYRIVRTSDAKESIKLLSDGEVDAAAVTLDEALALSHSGTAIKVVLVFNISVGADVVIARSDIENPSQLVGKRLGHTPGPLSELMLNKFLEHNNLSPQSIQLVPLEASEHPAAIVNGLVDAIITYSPTSNQLLMDGGNLLFDSSEMPSLIFDVLVVKESSMRLFNKTAIKRLVRSHFEGRQHLIVNPQDASYRLSSTLKLPADEVLKSYKGLVLPDVRKNHRLLGGKTPALESTAANIVTILSQAGYIDESTFTSGLFTNKYLPMELLQ